MSKMILFAVILVSLGIEARASICLNWLKSPSLGVSPLLETERMTLRRSYRDRSDSLQFKRLYMTPDVRLEFGPEGRRYGFPDIHVHRAGLGTYMDDQVLNMTLGFFSLSTGEMLGQISVKQDKLRSDILKDSIAFSYSVMPEARKKGYAREALARLMTDIERQQPHQVFQLFIADNNADSIKIARSLGFKMLKDKYPMDVRDFHIYVKASDNWFAEQQSYLAAGELTETVPTL